MTELNCLNERCRKEPPRDTDKVSRFSLSVWAFCGLTSAKYGFGQDPESDSSNTILGAPMDIRRVVGSNVRRRRLAAGLSQKELAAGMGVERGYVSRLEAGQRNPSIVKIWHAAEALGIHPAVLFRTSSKRSKRIMKRTKDKILWQI
jgi:ribosome-binding protein aMBF1 (putative translation factor)